MQRIYQYKGFTLDITVVPSASDADGAPARASAGYIALVKILHGDQAMATFAPLRLGDISGRPFASVMEALMGGYSAARKIVDDLFVRDSG